MKFILLFLLGLAVLSHQQEPDKCIKVACDKLIGDFCVKVDDDNLNAKMEACPEGKRCNIKTDIPDEDAKCEAYTPPKYKRYPGMICKENEDCLNNNCVNNECKETRENEICQSVDECEYGKTCRRPNETSTVKVCTSGVQLGGKCEEDTDCILTAGCLNNKCVEYFSLEDGENVGKGRIPSFLSLCKSGYATEEGVCATLKLVGGISKYSTPCNNQCEYKTGNGDTVTSESSCRCGYSREGTKFCQLGSGETNYTRYIQKLKEYHFVNGTCHLAERTGLGCVKDIVLGNDNLKNMIKKLNNYYIWAKKNVFMYDIDECVASVEFPDYDPKNDDPDPEPKEEQKCAAYSCGSSENYCASVTTFSPNNIKVELSDVCSKNSTFCKLGASPNIVFYHNENKTFSCGITDRYPGEDCSENSDCKSKVCSNKKCAGKKDDEDCTLDSDCLVGLYCDNKEKKCKKQKGLDEDCKNFLECKNSLLCSGGKCKDLLYSLEKGEEIITDNKNEDFFCKSGYSHNKKCVEIEDEYKNDFKECKLNDDCNYKYSSGETLTRKCECGFNSEGIGYCRKFHNYESKRWAEYYKNKKKLADNNCHTLSRYNCYLEDKSTKERNSEIKNKIIDAHLYKGSKLKCVEAVLGSSVVKYSVLAASLMMLLF